MKQNDKVYFKCECGNEWAAQDYIYITRRRIKNTTYTYRSSCPACGTTVDINSSDARLVEPSSRTPTKRVVINNEEYYIHGRDRSVIPADLEEVIRQSNRLLQESQGEEE